jgi:hypothetical protein
VPPPDDASAAPPLTPANKLMAPPAAAGDECFEFFLFFFASSAQKFREADCGWARLDLLHARPCQMGYGLVLIPTQNISSFTHHIKSFDACMKH